MQDLLIQEEKKQEGIKMPNKTLEEKREDMINFLLHNIVASDIERYGNDIVFTRHGGTTHFIKTLSTQSDFPYDFEEDPRNFDEGRRRLKAIRDGIEAFIQEKNEEGFIPGFVLLRADTDFSQLEERTKVIVNKGSFLKQELPSPKKRNPSTKAKILDPLEVVLQQFYRYNSKNSGKQKIRKGIYYFPELIYFNPKERIIEVAYFANLGYPIRFKLDNCPACEQPNGVGYDHQYCKATPLYRGYREARDRARYHRLLAVSLKRRSLESRCRTQIEKGLRFSTALLDSAKLSLPTEEMCIAVVRR